MSNTTHGSEPSWKKLKLSFERPYTDDAGNRLPVLYDLTPEGDRIYEPQQSFSERLESNIRRIFVERGANFFQQYDGLISESKNNLLKDTQTEEEEEGPEGSNPSSKFMTMEELYAMRAEIMPQLFVALGEMSHARDLLNAVLSGTISGQAATGQALPDQIPPDSSPSSLSATIVSKPPSIVSVQAFNSQLVIGSKDEALRKASGLFKSASESMERSRLMGEKYWVDALRIRRANWGLTPAPLPAGSATGKGADKTSKDFMISYGLERSPVDFRLRAIARMPIVGNSAEDINLPFHQNTRLRISITTVDGASTTSCFFVAPMPTGRASDPEIVLKTAQIEIIDQEIFSLLVKEAANLPTASARVSERLISIDAAQGLDLTVELVDTSVNMHPTRSDSKDGGNMCELIYHVLRVLLLRRHAVKNSSKGKEANGPAASHSLLQPIIDMLQYQVFCERVELELRKAVQALNIAGIPSSLSFTAIGESGKILVSLLSEESKNKKEVGGEAVIRMDNWHTLWFTFVSPSTLTAHLPQATLTISSLPQLSQLLMDEIERCILKKICAIGRQMSSERSGIWFVDLNRCIGKWEGCVLNFQVYYGDDLTIGCSAFRLDATTSSQGDIRKFSSGQIPLLAWVEESIQAPMRSQ
ncbi:Mediator of RNA polymerase II transcription subunit 17 [Psilocybe cubensis]|uniref:Mediator of RNA polymerase II transcription subunit 17 n=2 Tax=Psilocybe cubensis TaxID=181762 RepID=A0ACB8H3Y1_PSICU|nr:Mediator of RNA polymerase II transcription subunit 17 [Psilocybe cubensis]KAH9482703.1 Mediator of RNA polymerase II transcription subunit 17 [Psilocybe cubensis]